MENQIDTNCRPSAHDWDAYNKLLDPIVAIDRLTDEVVELNKAARDLRDWLLSEDKTLETGHDWLGIDLSALACGEYSDRLVVSPDTNTPRLEVTHLNRTFDIAIQPIGQDASDTPVLAVLRDITARAQADATRIETVSTVSHELRSPLTAIKGAMGLVLSGAAGDIPTRAHKMIAIAQRNADRLILIINDILDLDKISAGAMIFDNQDIVVADLVDDAVEAIAGFRERFDVEIGIDIQQSALVVWGDPNRLVQVLVNLLSNAIKFSPTAGRVVVRVLQHGQYTRISVADHGKGIPKSDQKHLFGRFVQVGAESRAATGGTGLGLSIVKAIMKGQGGHISFDSEVGKGTTFHIDLPPAHLGAKRAGAAT